MNAGRVVTYDQLLQWVWGPEKSGDVHMQTTPDIFAEPRVGNRMAKGEMQEQEVVYPSWCCVYYSIAP